MAQGKLQQRESSRPSCPILGWNLEEKVGVGSLTGLEGGLQA